MKIKELMKAVSKRVDSLIKKSEEKKDVEA